MKTILTTAIALLSFNLFAQNPSRIVTETNPDLGDDVGFVFETLDLTPVSSGILLERGFPMRDVSRFDGSATTDTLASYTDWFLQYGTMVTSKTGITSTIGVTTDYKPMADSLLKSGMIPIMVLHAEYHKFISDSTTLSSLITFQNNQLNDVAGRTTSPYELHEIVSFSPKQNKFYDKLSHDFRINVDFMRTNVSKTISAIQIDFDNGSGYQTITLGSKKRYVSNTFVQNKKQQCLYFNYPPLNFDYSNHYIASAIKPKTLKTMKHPTKLFLFFLLIFLTANSCKKDDDDNPSNDSDNFSEYFKCKINGVEFTTRSDFNCNGKTFYYYPAGAGGLDNAYMLISGENCHENLTVALRIYNPTVPSLGTFNFLAPEFADSSSPAIRHHILGDGVYVYESLLGGELSISTFTPRDSVTMEFGKLEGTFDFTVFNEELDSTVHVTDGSFRFKVANFW